MDSVFRPPFIALGLLGLALAANLGLEPPPFLDWPWRWAGALPLLPGVLLPAAALLRFHARGTPHDPYAHPKQLVVDGPYRITRNPMYLGVSLCLLGIGLFVARWPFLLVPPLFWLVVRTCFVPREERRLETTFGEAYLAYRARVRRWI